MPASRGGREVLKRRETPALLSLIDVVATADESVLPPGQRDASGFWYPASCSDPMELFTPYQRSLQEKQRSVHRERRQRRAASRSLSAEETAVTLCDQQVPLPPPCPEAAEP